MTNRTKWTELTQEELKRLFDYDPTTGIFAWAISKGTAKKGSVAGSISNQRGKRYITITISGKSYYAHRLAWLYVYGEFPNEDTDHIDGNGLNNKIINIRSATTSENCRNRRVPLNNKSGIIGVSWEKLVSKWRADITINGKKTCLGFFDELDDAAKIRKSAEIEHGYHPNHGAIRNCNG